MPFSVPLSIVSIVQRSEAAGAFRNWNWSRTSHHNPLHKDCIFRGQAQLWKFHHFNHAP